MFYIVLSVRPEASDWTGLNLGSPKKIVDQTDCSRLQFTVKTFRKIQLFAYRISEHPPSSAVMMSRQRCTEGDQEACLF